MTLKRFLQAVLAVCLMGTSIGLVLIRTATTSPDEVMVVGVVELIAMAGLTYWMDIKYDGVFPSVGWRWPRFAFLMALALTILAYKLWGIGPLVEYKYVALPRLAIALLLLWYGWTIVFGTNFFGLRIAEIMRNPAVLLRRRGQADRN